MCGFRRTGRPLSCGNCIAVYRKAHKLWFDDPQDSDPLRVIEQRKDALRSRELQFQVGAMDDHKNLPTLIGKLKIDWLNFPVDDILRQFTTLKDGILRGVFKQQAARAWYCCRTEKALVLLPGKCCYSTWTDLVDCMPYAPQLVQELQHWKNADQVSVSNLSLPSEAVIDLYRTFLARLPLPRLVHFLDLVLPQMHPHQQVRDRDDIRQLTSHYLSLHGQDGTGCRPPVQMNFLFHSHAGLVHVLVEWYRHPLLSWWVS